VTRPRLVGVAYHHHGSSYDNNTGHTQNNLLPEADIRCHSHETPSGTVSFRTDDIHPVTVAAVTELAAAAVVEAVHGSPHLHNGCCCLHPAAVVAGNLDSSAGSGTAAAVESAHPLTFGPVVVLGCSTGCFSAARIAVSCLEYCCYSNSAVPVGVHHPVRCWLAADFQLTAGTGH